MVKEYIGAGEEELNSSPERARTATAPTFFDNKERRQFL